MRSTIARIAAGATLLLALVACPATPSGSVTSVTIVGGDRTLSEGFGTTLDVEVVATGGASDGVTWTSDDEAVATVDAGGAVAALTAGTAVVSATSEADPTVSDSITLTVDPPGTLRWTRQFGTTDDDLAADVASDASGNVYVAGRTLGDLEGTNAGGWGAFVRAFDAAGNVRWTRQFGTSSDEFPEAVATDADGNVYVVGRTHGDLVGPSAGNSDAFVRSYDRDGEQRWTRQFGSVNSDYARGVATDVNGNVYVVGDTFGALEGVNAGDIDAYVRSYDASGNHRWTHQFGTGASDSAASVASDASGNVYVVGYTNGDLEGPNAGDGDAFVRSYDADGEHRWTRQFGTSSFDQAVALATDANGNVYAGGYTFGDLDGVGAGDFNAFVRSFDAEGEHRWTRQFGTSGDDGASGLVTDSYGNVYASGYTSGDLEGSNEGGWDAFVRSFDGDGAERWTRQFGTAADEFASGIAIDAASTLYVAGYTGGDLQGTNAGDNDAFVRSFGP